MNLVFITGTTRGLGSALASRFGERGWRVYPLNRPEFDLSKLDTMRLSHQFESAKSPDDERVLFVNNAAIINLYPAQITTQDRIRRDVESSITSPIAAMSAFIHAYPKGEVVNITSSCLETPFQHWGIYTASKAAIEAYLKVLQAEGYKTHNLNPGAMDTGMQDYIRSVDFPGVEQFKAMKAEGKLKDSKQVATAFVWKLEKSSGE